MAIVLAELAGEAGDTEPLPLLALVVPMTDANGMPPVLERNVNVSAAVLWPSASTVAVLGLSVNVMPLYVIVDVALRPLYAAVTVVVPSALAAGAVNVAAIVLAELAAEAGDTEPLPVFVIVAVADAIAAPPAVYRKVSVRATVLWPSASTVAVAGVRVSVMPWNVTFVWALVPAPYVAVTVAVWSVLVGLDVRVTVAWPLAFVVAVAVDSVRSEEHTSELQSRLH